MNYLKNSFRNYPKLLSRKPNFSHDFSKPFHNLVSRFQYDNTHPAHFSHIPLITLKILNEVHKLWDGCNELLSVPNLV
jgi:hypothetical protein